MYSLDNPKVKQFLHDWFSGGRYQFGQFRNKYASDTDGYIRFIKNSFLKTEPAFQSVQPAATIERLFWEFDTKDETENIAYDSKELDHIWLQTLKLYNKIECLNAKPLIVYSGRRGFHVWVYTFSIHFDKTSERLGKMLYKEMVYGILGENIREEFPNVDTVPLHVNALARMPFSYHQKSENQVVPLTKNRTPFIPDVNEYKENHISKNIMEKYACLVKNKMEKAALAPEAVFEGWKIRPCIKTAFARDVGHYANLALVLDAIYEGLSDEQIHGLFKLRNDYNETKTQYQIEYQREQTKEGVKPPSKETLIRWGICNECGHCGVGFTNPWKE